MYQMSERILHAYIAQAYLAGSMRVEVTDSQCNVYDGKTPIVSASSKREVVQLLFAALDGLNLDDVYEPGTVELTGKRERTTIH